MTEPMTPEALVAATAAPINALGALFYFNKATLAVGKEHGLDGFRYYVLGRGGVLGDVEPAVVSSAFGYFNPPTVAKMWNSAREVMAPREAARSYLACNATLGRGALGDAAGLAEFCEAAEQVVADVNPAALALYAGVAAEPLPDDLPARAMQLIVVHRELRGSAHLAAIVTAGLHPGVAHAIRRPNDIETFGWPADIAITDADRTLLADVDVTTNAVSAGHYRSLSDTQRRAFADGIATISAAFNL